MFRPIIFLLCCLPLLMACGELDDWQGTQRANTLEAYESFVERYPDSQYAPVARRRIASLAEERDWRLATERDTAQAYRHFLDAYPRGRWAAEARLRLQNFMAAPGALGPAAVEPIERPAEFIAAPQLRPVGPRAAAPTPGVISHLIQLGAFSSRQQAEQVWQQAQARHPDLRGLVPQIIAAPSVAASPGNGNIYRLRAGVVSEARAREICSALSSRGQACVYVPPGR